MLTDSNRYYNAEHNITLLYPTNNDTRGTTKGGRVYVSDIPTSAACTTLSPNHNYYYLELSV